MSKKLWYTFARSACGCASTSNGDSTLIKHCNLHGAAPDLLAACEEFLRFAALPDDAVPRGDYIRYQVKAISAAKEAIAKATKTP